MQGGESRQMWPPPRPPSAAYGHPYQHHHQQQHRQGRGSTLVFMLLAEIARQVSRLEHKPPVTLALLAANIGVFMYPDMLPGALGGGTVEAVCLHPARILGGLQGSRSNWWLGRLLLSGLVHADDRHLYYNMTSLLWKGINLETSMGSEAFMWLVAFSWVVSHSLYVIVAWLLLHLGLAPGSYHSCAVGFSAVLFSLKYVLNATSPGTTNVGGIEVPTRSAAWAELVLISLITPNASFLGHLCGILAGVLYLHGLRALRLAPGQHHPAATRRPPSSSSTSYTYQRGTWGTPPQPQAAHGVHGADDGGDEDEAVREAIRRSLRETGAGPTRPDATNQGSGSNRNRGEEDDDAEVKETLRRSAQEVRYETVAPSAPPHPAASQTSSHTGTTSSIGLGGGGALSREEMLRKRLERLDPSIKGKQR